jgi:DNA-binding Lrp family transcriptional regulator/uncharacterized ParB-like nuclease family protein
MGITFLKSTLANILNKKGSARKPQDEKEGIKSFKENQKVQKAVDRRYLGYREIPLRQIVGSVGRYRDFDSQFRLKKDLPSERLERVKEAFRSGKGLPPVELYRIKDEYYVLDGNHRVAAANELGWTKIEANILEYLPSKKTLDNILYREKADYELKTGLYDLIEVTEVGQYAYLLGQITEHRHSLEQVAGAPISGKNAARDWYKTIYLPFTAIIERGRLARAFPKRTLADLYAYISFHQWQKGRKRKYGIGLDQLIPKSMEEFRAKMAEMEEFEFPEMRRVITAFLLINVEAGREDRIMEKLFSYKEMQEIHFVPGDFDIIAKIAVEQDYLSSDSEVIGQFLHDKVRRMPGVIKTQTIIPISSKRRRGR